MGTAFIPVFEDAESHWPDDLCGKCLAKAANLLDKHCKELSIPTLFDFFSMTRETMITEVLDGDPEDPTTYDEALIPDEKWFDTSDGLATVKPLIDFVRANKSRFAKFDPLDLPDCVLQDLESFERHLSRAAERGVRWHLLIDY
jgi:hypothetical protein